VDIPLNDEGQKQVAQLGEQFAKRGGVDQIISGDLTRDRQTANAIAQAMQGEGIRIQLDPNFRPWHLGGFEGQKTKDVLPQMQDLAHNRPDTPAPGKNSQSTAPGESFNAFRDRFLSAMRGLQAQHEQDSSQKTAVISHFRGVKVMQAWLKKGAPDDNSVDVKEMDRVDGQPGSVHRFAPMGAKWRMTEEDMGQSAPLKPGIYLVRHGITDWNGEQGSGGRGFKKLGKDKGTE
jgi:broad specificity phosphatase PhoE